ncbi:hypothetical protein KY285_036318 [Solanum tuberosum]|nr:hypothetical protein KY285_036318 [Solanum tuberosum]
MVLRIPHFSGGAMMMVETSRPALGQKKLEKISSELMGEDCVEAVMAGGRWEGGDVWGYDVLGKGHCLGEKKSLKRLVLPW